MDEEPDLELLSLLRQSLGLSNNGPINEISSDTGKFNTK